jgi:hypothetical protein
MMAMVFIIVMHACTVCFAGVNNAQCRKMDILDDVCNNGKVFLFCF